jgi:lysophospholipase L1-like esterase
MGWWRLMALVVTGATLIGLTAAPAAAEERREDAGYLALGDSVAFGFNPLLDFRNAANFVGYPEAAAQRLDLDVTNASCPGEASGGFISLTGTDNGCRHYRAAPFPLHVSYSTSQLDFAVAFLRSHPQTRLVTLNIGANDLFVLQRACLGNITCIVNGFPTLLNVLSGNLRTIYGHIRGDAHYTHRLVALTYYLTNYNDPVGVSLIGALNGVVSGATVAAHGKVADGFDAFRRAAATAGGDSCAAGLLVVTSSKPLLCDVHPSALGRDALAAAVVDAVDDDR